MEKRGQAAVEFLMTYGWAILAAIIAIGVLAYFGVFSPGKYMVGQATVTAPFYANAYSLKTDGISLEFNNNGGEDFVIQSMTVSDCGINDTSVVIPADGQTVIFVPCLLTASSSFKGDIIISYVKSGSSLPLQSTGTVAGKVT